MPPNKPTAKPRTPGAVPAKPAKTAPDEAALRAVEAKYAQRERESTSLQHPETASSQARNAASSVARSGTLEQAYVRARDGQATRSTTIHLPVELHQRLRIAATTRAVHMSTIVAESVGDWLDTHNA